MNDFTKEELEDIENGLGWLCEHNPFHKVEIGKLMTKVKSLIDNYCDHEWELFLSPYGNVVRCKNCDKGIKL